MFNYKTKEKKGLKWKKVQIIINIIDIKSEIYMKWYELNSMMH